ncbi:MAG: hypothetical protein PVJ04_12905 [Gemmatimonadota bacterium]|jgi:hypothetical protein
MSLSKAIKRVSPESLFLVSAALLCTAELSILADPGYWAKAAVVAPAVMADLALGMPFLGYLFLVRNRRFERSILLPLFMVGALLARWWIPASHQRASLPLSWSLVALEGGLLVFLGIRARRIRAIYRAELRRRHHKADALRIAFSEVLGRRLGGAVFTEGAAVGFALFAWGRARAQHSGGTLFPSFRRNAYPAVILALLMAVLVETLIVHLLVGLWSVRVAWILTALGVYTMFWLVGDLNAARSIQTLATNEGIHLRAGLRWQMDAPWSDVAGFREGEPEEGWVKMTMMGAPDFWIEFREPLVVRGILGIERRVRFVGLAPDDPERFQRLVTERIGGGVVGPG